jgi:hypothetical protein
MFPDEGRTERYDMKVTFERRVPGAMFRKQRVQNVSLGNKYSPVSDYITRRGQGRVTI